MNCRCATLTLLLLVLAIPAHAQPARVSGYVVGGASVWPVVFQGGGGVDVHVIGRLGLAGEASLLFNGDGALDAYGGDVTLSLARAAPASTLPYVAAGYTRLGVFGETADNPNALRVRAGIRDVGPGRMFVEFASIIIIDDREPGFYPMLRLGVILGGIRKSQPNAAAPRQ